MESSLLFAVLAVAALGVVLQAFQLWRGYRVRGPDVTTPLREEFRAVRDESSQRARELRDEVAGSLARATELINGSLNAARKDQREASEAIEHSVRDLSETNRTELMRQRDAVQAQLEGFQEVSLKAFEHVRSVVELKLTESSDQQLRRNAEVVEAVRDLTEVNRDVLDKQRQAVQSQLDAHQKATQEALVELRAMVEEKLRLGQEDQRSHLAEFLNAINNLGQRLQQSQDKARETIDAKLQQIQESNERKLEEMRQTVDEKLHKTLEARLGESFKLVSERLEAVQKGLGEMQELASGVGDLKRVLTNVKDRGTWGEYQLGAILEQVLTPEQYGQNVAPTESGERVEFAVRMPGEGRDFSKPVWLPIDAKFPKEEYERLVAASQAADAAGVEESTKRLLGSLSKSAKDIHDKYISPPHTTDFGIMFLPTEGLYAEALRQPGFQDEIQRKYRVLIAGPATMAAILTSLRVGFQTLAIEQRAGEIWDLLRAVKTEFGKFGDHLARVKRQLNAASTTIEQTETRTRAMVRKLKDVEALPGAQSTILLGLPRGEADGGGSNELGVGESD